MSFDEIKQRTYEKVSHDELNKVDAWVTLEATTSLKLVHFGYGK